MRLKYFGIDVKKNNEGFSLVELIVAISVGVIISGAVASIIMISTRMYSRETVNIAEQYEIQTTLNQTVDSAENAQWVALGPTTDSVATKYVAFGKLTGATGSMTFEGEIFTCDYDSAHPGKFNVYMDRYGTGSGLSVVSEKDAGTAIASAAGSIIDEKYLLGEGATSFVVSFVDADKKFINSSDAKLSDKTTVARGFFESPLMVKISMDFEKKSMTGDITKHVEDTVTFRNRFKRSVYLGETGKGYYVPKK